MRSRWPRTSAECHRRQSRRSPRESRLRRDRPPTSPPGCWPAPRFRRACCRSSPPSLGCSTTSLGPFPGCRCCSTRIPPRPMFASSSRVIFGRAHRYGGTQRMLMELAYYSPDRPAAYARAASVWERLGRTREACAEWIHAARLRDDPEDADLDSRHRMRAARSGRRRLARDPQLRPRACPARSSRGDRRGPRRSEAAATEPVPRTAASTLGSDGGTDAPVEPAMPLDASPLDPGP